MALNIAVLLITCFVTAWIFQKIKIPGLIPMLLLGVLFGPYALGWLDETLLMNSSDLPMVALVVILLRAGFELPRNILKKIGVKALILAIVPALFEAVIIIVLAPKLLGISYFEATLLGTILAAVSPAVVITMMIQFADKGKGEKKGIPALMLTASAFNAVLVILVFSILVGIYTGKQTHPEWSIASIPISIILGIGVGLITGFCLHQIFKYFKPGATRKVLTLLAISILLMYAEKLLENIIAIPALLAVIAIGVIMLDKSRKQALEMSSKLAKIWIPAEIILFTLVGAQVNIEVALESGLAGAAVILAGLIARSIGSYICLIGSDFTPGEKFFIVISYTPKATVQAAIAGVPLAIGMNAGSGEIILAVAVLSILLTAPVGAWAIAKVGNKVLK